MRQRTRWAVVFAGCVLLFLGACDGAAPASPTPAPATIHIAAIFPGKITDNGWSQQGYAGLLLCKNTLGAEIAYTEDVSGSDIAAQKKAIRALADTKIYDLIIGHGGEFEQALIAIAPDYPQQRFGVISNYAGNNANLSGINWTNGTAAYLMGAVAGLKTQTGKVSLIRTDGTPGSNEAVQIERGIKAANPNAHYLGMQILSDWDGTGAAAQTERAIAAGVDTIIVNSDVGDTIVAKTASAHPGVAVVPWTTALGDGTHPSVLSALNARPDILYLESARQVLGGRWSGHSYRFGLREHAIEMTPFPKGSLTADATQRYGQIMESLLTGAVDTSAIPPGFTPEAMTFN